MATRDDQRAEQSAIGFARIHRAITVGPATDSKRICERCRMAWPCVAAMVKGAR